MKEKMKKKFILFGLGLIFLMDTGSVMAQDAPSKPSPAPAAPAVPEETFEAKFDLVYEKLLSILKEHDLPISSADKEKGTISTGTKRYFKIFSATFPPVQSDYRDTYKINVVPASSATKVQIERKFEIYDSSAKNWVDGNPQKENAGLSVENIFEELRGSLPEKKSPS
jgi:hypothetical protein